ncbi:hypothetical protein [Nocardioides coralli]|uniref:hypothetical protein n=1 Tax=Nocardioides coralli TaxID=2872154 RepID=UPI001CA3901C|nr:hypothetical protein [Nocardioides coralli]QZY27641.1 hypothetical protein K6T13_08885 [Nocardioides coralli]
MDRRTALATARTVARKAGRISSKVALRVGEEIRERLEARRLASAGTPARTDEPRRHAAATPAAPDAPGAPEPVPPAPSRGPSPADVARAVQRNAAGLTRAAPQAPRGTRRRTGPGAKLPARAGQGIVGV